MGATVFDSLIFRNLFGTADMRELFCEQGFLARCIDAETALARAQARVGLIPADAARDITALADASKLDLEALGAESEIVGFPVQPLVRQLHTMCGPAGKYLHWGATTQDIMDTATMLLCAQGLARVSLQLDDLRSILAGLAQMHADTITAGRTHLQHALPITFGYRVAVWLSALDRHAERLQQCRERSLMAQLGGAVGTLASMGDPAKALEVRRLFAEELGLRNPDITWHVARDGVCEIVQLLAAIGASVGKIGLDVMLMAGSEMGEVAEPFVPGRGSSSTMPQKRNPISCELIVACARMLRERASLMLDAMVQDFERATGPWHLEWSAVPESFLLIGSALSQASFMLRGLSVDPARMRKNLDLTGGLIVAEAVMMGLAPVLGRQQAHDIVYDACQAAIEQGRSLHGVLMEVDEVRRVMSAEQLLALTEPQGYVGAAALMARAVATQAR